MSEEQILELIAALEQIEQDLSVPKNVRMKVKGAMDTLMNQDVDLKLKANKALQELDDISNDLNVPSYVWPQIWNVVSMLEGL